MFDPLFKNFNIGQNFKEEEVESSYFLFITSCGKTFDSAT